MPKHRDSARAANSCGNPLRAVILQNLAVVGAVDETAFPCNAFTVTAPVLSNDISPEIAFVTHPVAVPCPINRLPDVAVVLPNNAVFIFVTVNVLPETETSPPACPIAIDVPVPNIIYPDVAVTEERGTP